MYQKNLIISIGVLLSKIVRKIQAVIIITNNFKDCSSLNKTCLEIVLKGMKKICRRRKYSIKLRYNSMIIKCNNKSIISNLSS